MSVARLLLCYVLLEDYSTNLSAAISSRNTRSTGSNAGRSGGNVVASTSEVVQRDLTLEDNGKHFSITIHHTCIFSELIHIYVEKLVYIHRHIIQG